MKQDEIEKILKNYGVNSKLRGFDLLVKLIMYIIKDVEDNRININNYTLKDYYVKLSNDFDMNVASVPSNIQTAVKSNLYGNGLTPKDAINIVLVRYERQKERGKNK